MLDLRSDSVSVCRRVVVLASMRLIWSSGTSKALFLDQTRNQARRSLGLQQTYALPKFSKEDRSLGAAKSMKLRSFTGIRLRDTWIM